MVLILGVGNLNAVKASDTYNFYQFNILQQNVFGGGGTSGRTLVIRDKNDQKYPYGNQTAYRNLSVGDQIVIEGVHISEYSGRHIYHHHVSSNGARWYSNDSNFYLIKHQNPETIDTFKYNAPRTPGVYRVRLTGDVNGTQVSREYVFNVRCKGMFEARNGACYDTRLDHVVPKKKDSVNRFKAPLVSSDSICRSGYYYVNGRCLKSRKAYDSYRKAHNFYR